MGGRLDRGASPGWIVLSAATLFAAGTAHARAGEDSAPPPPLRPVVVEMFISQSCPQSPKAADFMTELARRPDVVALAWHVGYWDQLPAHKVGPWADRFASPESALRQKAYNKRIRGRGLVFTPQAVVDGFLSGVASKRAVVEAEIKAARKADNEPGVMQPILTVDPAQSEGEKIIRVRISDVGAPYDVLAVDFKKSVETKITGGDNAGVVFREANVATGVKRLAADREGAGEFSFKSPAEGESCAVLVQERGQGRIVAARYCPPAAQ